MENARDCQEPVEIGALKLLEADQVFLLAGEGLRDAHPGDVLRHGAGDPGALRAQLAIRFHAVFVEGYRGDGQRRDHQAHGQAEAPVILQEEHDHAEQRQRAGEQLVRAPGQYPVERINVRVGAIDNAALVGPVEIIERQPLDVLEDRQTQVVHSALADGDGAFDLGGRQEPSQQKVAQINQADDEDALKGGRWV